MNEEQIKAVQSLNNTLLIAGAGSGKTFTITKKIEYLISNKYYKESEILVISFTNESVNDLKNKINYNIDIKTFHKLGIDLLNNPNKNIVSNNYLDYIINEYFSSYARYDKKTKRIINRVKKEQELPLLKKLISTFINLYKSNYKDINYLFNLYKKSYFLTKDYFKIILDIYLIYTREIESTYSLDFNDMIINATNKIKKGNIKTKYKFIIIDEFQDTSLIRFNLIKAIIDQNNAILFAVGDDYQSIYRFSGCTLNLFLNLNKYINNLKVIKLKMNYRNNQSTIDIANNFIIKNKYQIQKETICLKDTNKPIKIIFYVDKATVINKLIKNINTKILILGRNNQDKDYFNVTETDKIKYLTIHKSKGLESDNVIIINLENSNYSLPTKIKNHYIINKILPNSDYPFDEERRLFYVAITRSKNNTYLLVPKNNPSIFIKELIKDNKNKLEIINNY